MWIFWLIVAGVFFVIELLTTGFLVFWLGLSALVAMILSFFTTNLVIQTAVFVILSIILMIFTRPLVNKITKSKNVVPTNVYSIIGKKGIVVDDINNIDYTGKVKVAGELWSAISDSNLTKGTHITVSEVNGVKLKVEKIEDIVSQK